MFLYRVCLIFILNVIDCLKESETSSTNVEEKRENN